MLCFLRQLIGFLRQPNNFFFVLNTDDHVGVLVDFFCLFYVLISFGFFQICKHLFCNYRNLKSREKVSSLRKQYGVSTSFYMIHLQISSAKNKPMILLSLFCATSAGKTVCTIPSR